MTSFVHVDQSFEHPGVRRAENAFAQLRAVGSRLDGARGLAALLLAAMVSALLVVADHLISSWSDGGLLAAWVGLWAVAFVGLALLAGSARSLAVRLRSAWIEGARRRAEARADARFLAFAQTDERVMRDLMAAATRQEADDVAAVATAPAPAQVLMAKRSKEAAMPTLYEAMRRMNSSRYY